MVNDPMEVNDGLIYAQPNKKAKQTAKHDTWACGSKGKSPTDKGRKSRKSLNIYITCEDILKKCKCFELQRLVLTSSMSNQYNYSLIDITLHFSKRLLC